MYSKIQSKGQLLNTLFIHLSKLLITYKLKIIFNYRINQVQFVFTSNLINKIFALYTEGTIVRRLDYLRCGLMLRDTIEILFSVTPFSPYDLILLQEAMRLNVKVLATDGCLHASSGPILKWYRNVNEYNLNRIFQPTYLYSELCHFGTNSPLECSDNLL